MSAWLLFWFVALVVYVNIGWLHAFFTFNRDNWFSKFLRCADCVPENDRDIKWGNTMAIFWPLALATSIIFWLCWLLFGGGISKLMGEKINR